MIGAVATISVVEGKEKEFEKIAIKLVEAVNLEDEDNLFYSFIWGQMKLTYLLPHCVYCLYEVGCKHGVEIRTSCC